MSIIIGIPAYNEEQHIAKVVSKAKHFGEVLVCDDGSTDNTRQVAEQAGATVITYEHQGYGRAISRLFTLAKARRGRALVILDGDGQHNPAEIPAFLDALGACDVVIGNRFMGATKHETPAYRKAMIDIVNASLGVGDAQCGFRAYNRKAIQTINVKEEGMGASIEILQQAKKLGLKIREVPCTISYKDTKHSQHPLTHGYDLVEVIFWHYVWEKPLRTLGISSIISLFLGVFFSI